MRILALALLLFLTLILFLVAHAKRPTTTPQQITGCFSWEPDFADCGDAATCGHGDVRSDVISGTGTKGLQYQTVPCAGTSCASLHDIPRAVENPGCATPTPTPTPCGDTSAFCSQDRDCCSGNHCDAYSGMCSENGGCLHPHDVDDCWDEGGHPDPPPGCECHWGGPGSPIIIDVLGDGFVMTDADQGVLFDLNGNGITENISWTATGSDDAFLVLDRNNNGTIDRGTELFGNFTRQPPPPLGLSENGFNALAVFDRPEKGGNNDGIIDVRDAVFAKLRLWQDTNHNAVSEPSELHKLKTLGVESISLNYKESKRTDQYGNQFKYRAKVDDAQHSHVGRWAWDVFLVGPALSPARERVSKPARPNESVEVAGNKQERGELPHRMFGDALVGTRFPALAEVLAGRFFETQR